jgi:hypothetical protein
MFLACALVSADNYFTWHSGGPGSIPGRPCGICGGQSSTETGLYPGTLVYLCNYHSTTAAYSLVHLSPTL